VNSAEQLTIRQISWRFLPLLIVAYFVSFIDRVNVGFAALQMNADLGLSSSAFGFGAGLFYLSYALLEVPSNLIMRRVGARLWLARIMVSWGLLAAAMALVSGPRSFYAMRLLLGAAEAGFFPGVILFITDWYPRAYRARIIALFMVAIPLSSFFGGPLSAELLKLDGLAGLRGWQWLYLVEGTPAVLLGLLTLFVLEDSPANARWLDSGARQWLQLQLATPADVPARLPAAATRRSTWQLMRQPTVQVAALMCAGSAGVSQCLANWQPQIIKSFGLGLRQTGLASAAPYLIASIAMIWWGRHSDRQRERFMHTSVPLALSALALCSALWLHGLWPMLLLLTVVLVAIYAFKGPFWALSSEWLAGPDAAAGLALVNAAAAAAAFGANWLFGLIRDATGSYALAMQPMTALSFVGLIALLLTRRKTAR
jgi:MFS transporter, ACS family, tartrate transporter